MKVVFVGPSFPDIGKLSDVEIRPPACQGDVMRAVRDGATAIGLIDGQFEFVAPVWHKELLFALSQNIGVFGAASMGALRAAECAAFGMTSSLAPAMKVMRDCTASVIARMTAISGEMEHPAPSVMSTWRKPSPACS